MRLAELSDRSGVSTATIKYYLREGVLPPGRRITATQAEYDEEHLRRLRLVRALVQIARVPVATVREVLASVDDTSLNRTFRMGAALWALPGGPEPEEDDALAAARREVDRLLERDGWAHAREIGELSPAHRALTGAVATLLRLGYPCDADLLAPYARQVRQMAVQGLDDIEEFPTHLEQVEAAVAYTLLFEPVLLGLRRLALEEETVERFGL
ncbi:MerR family transcriptional regulator [Streptomyces thermolineatus]|uniref:MerR family transcriptional regulator n=1 Tax=Streptomyces thermolineatus TaxID=44033 RepID=A0ABN3M1M5_9ACTN